MTRVLADGEYDTGIAYAVHVLREYEGELTERWEKEGACASS